MDVRIIDTTLRVSEQLSGRAIKCSRKLQLAKMLDSIGVYQIEAGIPALGADARKSIAGVAEAGLQSRISSWNRLDLADISASMECGVDVVHISVPSSDFQISRKLNKTREWVLEHLKKCIFACTEKGFEVSVGFEDAAGTEAGYLRKLIACAANEGAAAVRYDDTAGLLLRKHAYEEILAIKEQFPVALEISAHNEFGMAVANSIAAVKAGAERVICTAGGIGEGAGNCSLLDFIKAAVEFLDACGDLDEEQVCEVCKNVLSVIRH